MSQARNWVYTLNNPTVTLEQANAALREINSFLFHACQLERGESGTLHIQGYVQFSRPVRLTQLTARLMGAHWETRRGSHQQALTYVTKAESRVSGPFQDGEANEAGQGARTDLANAIATMETDGLQGLVLGHPEAFVRYGAGLMRLHLYRELLTRDRSRPLPPKVVISYGPPGCGKSSLFFRLFPRGFSLPLADAIWFDGYIGQRQAIIDDFCGRASKYSLDLLLKLLDAYMQCVTVKGSTVLFDPDEIHLTTNVHPVSWYDYCGRSLQYEALIRRVSVVNWWPSARVDPTVILNPGNPIGMAMIREEATAFMAANADLFGLPPIPQVDSDWIDGQYIPANQMALYDVLFPPPPVPLYADLEAYVSRLVVFYQQRMDHFARPPADFSFNF